ncbi:Uncharacterised protein [Mycobacterium tuberculosis]|nr:Uncharacterised protein [Mycobacterium tuberculosis]
MPFIACTEVFLCLVVCDEGASLFSGATARQFGACAGHAVVSGITRCQRTGSMPSKVAR